MQRETERRKGGNRGREKWTSQQRRAKRQAHFAFHISVGQGSLHSLLAINVNRGLGRCFGGSSSCQSEFGSQNSHKQPVTGEHSCNPNTRRQIEQVSGLSCTPR